MKNIATALVKAQKAYSPIIKNSTNEYFSKGNKVSRYADLASCVDAVLGALNDNGISLIQQTHDHPDGVIVETMFLHESGESLSCGRLYFPAAKNDPQGYMSALTYARRGSLMAACGIAPEDDDGNAASRKTESKIPEGVMADHLAAISASANSEELQKAYSQAYEACKGDQGWQAKVIAAKKARVEKAKKESAK
jgi:hypothetical protein